MLAPDPILLLSNFREGWFWKCRPQYPALGMIHIAGIQCKLLLVRLPLLSRGGSCYSLFPKLLATLRVFWPSRGVLSKPGESQHASLITCGFRDSFGPPVVPLYFISLEPSHREPCVGGIALRLHPGIATSGLEITPRKVFSRFPILLRSLLIPDLCEVAVESSGLVDFLHSISLMCLGGHLDRAAMLCSW